MPVYVKFLEIYTFRGYFHVKKFPPFPCAFIFRVFEIFFCFIKIFITEESVDQSPASRQKRK